MKHILGALIVFVLLVGYFINKSNKEDQERIKQTQISQQQRLEQNKLDEAQSQKRLEEQRIQFEEAKTLKAEQDNSNIQNMVNSAQTENDPESTPIKIKKEFKPTKNKYTKGDWLAICKSSSRTARIIMQKRQEGIAMSEMMNTVVATADPEIKPRIRSFVIDAYNEQEFETPERKHKSSVEFENKSYVNCLNSYSEEPV